MNVYSDKNSTGLDSILYRENAASIYQAEGGRILNSSLISSAVLSHRFIVGEF